MLKFLILCWLSLSVKGFWHRKSFEYFGGNEATRRAFWSLTDHLPMKVDHFSSDNATFNMRFTCNGRFYTGSGPLFVVIGGESSIDGRVHNMYSGPIYDMAVEKGAYMCMTEHRFYGESIPNSNLDISNMRYLTVEQALADLAGFIVDRKNKIPGLGKVLVVGGSYSATLAAWARLKYPHLVDIAYSSSGIFNLKPNNYEYNEVVQKVLKKNEPCLNTIKNAFSTITELVKTDYGIRKIRRDFSLTYLWDKTDSFLTWATLETMISFVDNTVQYNTGSKPSVDTMCEILLNDSINFDDYNRFVKYLYLKQSRKQYDKESISLLKQKSETNQKSWIYQMCTQIGSFTTTDSKNQPFGDSSPIRMWIAECRNNGIDTTLEKISSNTQDLMLRYGGLHPPVKNTVFTIGAEDPWSGIGLREGNNDTAPLIVIEGASHCNDLSPQSPGENPSVTEARRLVKKYIYSWL